MQKRQGFALLWVVSAVSVVFLLGGTALFALQTAIRHERAMEAETDEAFLAQEVLEIIKYNRVSSEMLSVPSGSVERNGKRYYVEIKENNRTIEGVPMQEISCTVTDKAGTSFSVTTILEVP